MRHTLGAPRQIVLLTVLFFIAVLTAWHLARFTPRTALLAILVLVTPWLLLLPGLINARRKYYQFGTILCAPYLAYGLMEVLANPGARVFAGATVLGGFALFVALVHALKVADWA